MDLEELQQKRDELKFKIEQAAGQIDQSNRNRVASFQTKLWSELNKPTPTVKAIPASKPATVNPGTRATGVSGIMNAMRQKELNEHIIYPPTGALDESGNPQKAQYDFNAPDVRFWSPDNPKAADSGNVLYDLRARLGGGQGGTMAGMPDLAARTQARGQMFGGGGATRPPIQSTPTDTTGQVMLDPQSYEAAMTIEEILKAGDEFDWDTAMRENPNLDWDKIRSVYQ